MRTASGGSLLSVHWSALNRNRSLAAVTHIRLSLWIVTLTLIPLSAVVLVCSSMKCQVGLKAA